MIERILELGLAAGGLAALVRVAAPASQQKKKPVGCNACLGAWTALFVLLFSPDGHLPALTIQRFFAWCSMWMAMSAVAALVLAVAVPLFFLDDLPPEQPPKA